MSMLHLVHTLEAVEACFIRVDAGDAVVLMDDAVRTLIGRGWVPPRGPSVFVLKAHGFDPELSPGSVAPECALIDLAGLVRLTEQHASIIQWR